MATILPYNCSIADLETLPEVVEQAGCQWEILECHPPVGDLYFVVNAERYERLVLRVSRGSAAVAVEIGLGQFPKRVRTDGGAHFLLIGMLTTKSRWRYRARRFERRAGDELMEELDRLFDDKWGSGFERCWL